MSIAAQNLRRQEEHEATRAIRRRTAVVAATDLFAREGFHATAMTDIAKTAGLSLKALYNSFPSKEDLFAAVLTDVGERFSVLIKSRAPEVDPREWLLDFVDRTIALLAANTSALRLYSRGVDGIPTALRDRGLDPFAGFVGRVEAVLADAIRDVQRSGGARYIDGRVLARCILTVTIAEARHGLDSGTPLSGVAADLKPVVSAMLA